LPADATRGGFIRTGAAGLTLLSFSIKKAQGEARELKISRTTETRSTCLYHPLIGLAFITTFLWMWMWMQWKDMPLTEADAARQNAKVPPADRCNADQKQFFWIMFYAGIVLLLSGVVLWWADLLPWSMRWLTQRSVAVVAFLATVSSRIPRAWVEAHHPFSPADSTACLPAPSGWPRAIAISARLLIRGPNVVRVVERGRNPTDRAGR
jgi:hypothetical protein